jgi:hypothetical protein
MQLSLQWLVFDSVLRSLGMPLIVLLPLTMMIGWILRRLLNCADKLERLVTRASSPGWPTTLLSNKY